MARNVFSNSPRYGSRDFWCVYFRIYCGATYDKSLVIHWQFRWLSRWLYIFNTFTFFIQKKLEKSRFFCRNFLVFPYFLSCRYSVLVYILYLPLSTSIPYFFPFQRVLCILFIAGLMFILLTLYVNGSIVNPNIPAKIPGAELLHCGLLLLDSSFCSPSNLRSLLSLRNNCFP